MIYCPICLAETGGIDGLASHFYDLAGKSDPKHVMWLNRNIGIHSLTEGELAQEFNKFFHSPGVLSDWIFSKFIRTFYGPSPHPFILEMQRPSSYVLAGYAIEHYHFLRQWVKSCLAIASNSDILEVQRYEIDNVKEEYLGNGKKPHVELLIEMGTSLGLNRDEIIHSRPLKGTEEAILFWDSICRSRSWLEGMAAMHSLELIANRNIVKMGGTCNYFVPEYVKENFPEEVWNFLGAGYEADVYHSMDALKIIDKYATGKEDRERVQSAFLASTERFYTYLSSRLERGREIEKKL